ncbi:hypothetical protein M1523_00915 [Patescibacteria group bacterium]|nr:hypothetical protein [Patescibacteria group bacterium]MCL5091718.1 hypothetical protein [Patescibacteria group bacterium]
MSRKELLIIAVGIFLTVIAWMIIDVYNVSNSPYTNLKMEPVTVPSYHVDTKTIETLKNKQP